MNTPEPALSFDDTLNLSLQALLHDRDSLEVCLEKYPHYAAELKPLLQTALLTQRLRKPILSEARVNALQDRLMQAFPSVVEEDETPTQPVRRPVMLFPAWMSRSAAIVALVLLAALGTGGGTVAASANSVPGETLYGVKRAWEEFILFFATLLGCLNEMQLHLARVRWEELQTLSQRDHTISDDLWNSFAIAFKSAYEEADTQTQSDLMRVMADVEMAVNQSVLPATYHAELLAILTPVQSGNTDQVALPVVTQEGVATEDPVLQATLTSTSVPTQAQIVLSTPTAPLMMIVDATATRTPTPSRTPTPTYTPMNTPTPLTPLPSATATYTPLFVPPTVVLIATEPRGVPLGSNPGTNPSVPVSPSDPNAGGVPSVPVETTYDPIIRPTMRAVYATQTALAIEAEQTNTAEQP